jgi:hypothetical protein
MKIELLTFSFYNSTRLRLPVRPAGGRSAWQWWIDKHCWYAQCDMLSLTVVYRKDSFGNESNPPWSATSASSAFHWKCTDFSIQVDPETSSGWRLRSIIRSCFLTLLSFLFHPSSLLTSHYSLSSIFYFLFSILLSLDSCLLLPQNFKL